MTGFQSRMLLAGGLFLVAALAGIWLARTGKAYPLLPFNLHKFTVLAFSAILIHMFIQMLRLETISSPIVVTGYAGGILLLAAIVSGGFISALDKAPGFLFLLHRILSAGFLTVLILFFWQIREI